MELGWHVWGWVPCEGDWVSREVRVLGGDPAWYEAHLNRPLPPRSGGARSGLGKGGVKRGLVWFGFLEVVQSGVTGPTGRGLPLGPSHSTRPLS